MEGPPPVTLLLLIDGCTALWTQVSPAQKTPEFLCACTFPAALLTARQSAGARAGMREAGPRGHALVVGTRGLGLCHLGVFCPSCGNERRPRRAWPSRVNVGKPLVFLSPEFPTCPREQMTAEWLWEADVVTHGDWLSATRGTQCDRPSVSVSVVRRGARVLLSVGHLVV